MLNVFVCGDSRPAIEVIPPGMKYIENVEAVSLVLQNTPLENTMLEVIEKGKYLSPSRFTDRFGDGLSVSEMSTGCKAALAVVHYPEYVINLDECGPNAIAAILTLCREGNVAIYECSVTYPHLFGKNPSIEVRVGEYWFDNLDRLSGYVTKEFPHRPAMYGGVHHV